MQVALFAASSLANEQCHHEASKLALGLVELMLANEQHRLKAAK